MKVKTSLRITKAGFLYILLSIFIGISAVNTGNNLLFVLISLLLSFMWLSGVFARANLSGIEVRVKPPKETYARGKALFFLYLKRKGPLTQKMPLFLLRLKLLIKDPEGRERSLPVKIGLIEGEGEVLVEGVFEKRGRYELEGIEVSSIFPIGFFTRGFKQRLKGEFFVFPEPVKCQSLSEFEKGRARAEDKYLKSFGTAQFEGLSEYTEGTPKKFIDWKSFTKWEELKRKVFAEELKPPEIIDVLKLPALTLEEKLSCAVYLILESSRKGAHLGMRLGREVFPAGTGEAHRLKLLKALALYEER